MERFVDFVLKRRWVVIAVIAALTVAAGAIVAQATIASSIGKLFFGDAPIYLRYLDRIAEFGTDEVIVLGVEDVSVLDPETLDKVEEAVRGIRAFEPVQRVMSILDAQWIRGKAQKNGRVELKTQSYASEARKDPSLARRAELLAKLQADPAASGLLVSGDGRQMIIVVELYPNPDRSAEEGPGLVGKCLDELVAAGFERSQLRRAGQTAAMAEMVKLTRTNLVAVFPLVGLVLLIVVWLLFRRLWPVAVSMGVSLIAVVWTMGIAVLLDKEISILHSITPIVILIVGFSDVIHLCSAYLLELSHGRGKMDAIVASAQDVGRACVYTSMTTFFGFAGMAFVPTPAFRTLGITLGAGVASALLIAVTLVPVIFSFMREPKPWRQGATSRVQDWLDRVLEAFSRTATGRPRMVIAGFVLAFGLACVGLAQLNIDASMTERLGDDNPVARDKSWFEAHFAGANFFDLFVDVPPMELQGEDKKPARCMVKVDCPTPPKVVDEFEGAFDDPEDFDEDATSISGPDGVRCVWQREHIGGTCTYGAPDALWDPDHFSRLVRLHDAIVARKDTDDVQSVVTLYDTMHQALHPEGGAGRMPTDRGGLAQYALVFGDAGGRDFDRIVDFDRRTARLSIRLEDEAFREAYRSGNEIAELGREIMGAEVRVEPSGMLYLMGGWMDKIIAGQRRGLVFTFIAIAILMVIGLRSIRVGLWSMVPNTLPLLLLGGFLGLVFDVVDSDTLILAMLAIGIGVDDTIHFMMRYQIEAKRTPDRALALKNTYDFAGRAIVMTTVTLAIGFSPMLTSQYTTTQLIGALLPLTLVLALLADLLLVPALAQVGPMAMDFQDGETTRS